MSPLTITFGILSLLSLHCFALEPLDGDYVYQGITCKSENDLTLFARSYNEDYRFREKQTILRFSKAELTSKTRAFKFKGYRSDACEAQLRRSIQITGSNLVARLIEKKVFVTGEFDKATCEFLSKREDVMEVGILQKGDTLYLQSKSTKSDGLNCKTGPVFHAYRKTKSFDFAEVKRPEKSEFDQKFQAALKENPKNQEDLSKYSIYLFREDRLSEAKANLGRLKEIDPMNSTVKMLEPSIAQLEAERDPEKRRSLRAKLSAQLLSSELQSVTSGLTEMTKSLEKIQSALGPEEVKKAQASIQAKKDSRRDRVLQRYPVVRLKDQQYEPGLDEHKAYLACVQLMTDNYQQAKAMMEKAIKDYPSSPFILEQYVNFLFDAGDYDKGISKFESEKNKFQNQLNMMALAYHVDRMKGQSEPGMRKEIFMELKDDLLGISEARRSQRQISK